MQKQESKFKQFLANTTNSQRLVALSLGAILLLLVILFGLKSAMDAGKISYLIKVAPYAAEIRLNDKPVKNNSKNLLEPGQYTLSAKFDHFESAEFVITVDKDHLETYHSLVASDKEGERYINQHLDEFGEIDQYLAGPSIEMAHKTHEAYPIITQLPLNTDYYSLYYELGEPNSDDPEGIPIPRLIVKSEEHYLGTAISYLKDYQERSKDDLSRYQIEFQGQQNPFADLCAEHSTGAQTEALDFVNECFQLDASRHVVNEESIDGYHLFKIRNNELFEDGTTEADYLVVVRGSAYNWELLNNPQVILTDFNTQGIPKNILQKANEAD